MIDTMIKNIFTMNGRLNRLRYFKYMIIFAVAITVISVILFWFFGDDEFVSSVIKNVMSIIMAIGTAMLQIRRLHDLDKSGWFVLLSTIPVVNVFFGFYLLIAKGTDGTNRYGYDPLIMND